MCECPLRKCWQNKVWSVEFGRKVVRLSTMQISGHQHTGHHFTAKDIEMNAVISILILDDIVISHLNAEDMPTK